MRAMTEAEDIVTFIRAGDAIFTVKSGKTGQHYTYNVRASKKAKTYFVDVLTGPDNLRDYTYAGYLDSGGFVHPKKGGGMTPALRALDWFLWYVTAHERLDSSVVSFYHLGRCGRCGRALTTPESVERGIGPECAKKLEG